MAVESAPLESEQDGHFVLGLLGLPLPVLGVDGPKDVREVVAHVLHLFGRRDRFELLVPLLEQVDTEGQLQVSYLLRDFAGRGSPCLVALVHYFTDSFLHLAESPGVARMLWSFVTPMEATRIREPHLFLPTSGVLPPINRFVTTLAFLHLLYMVI